MLERVSSWHHYLATTGSDEQLKTLRQKIRSGRPAGDKRFIEQLERMTGLTLSKEKPGRRTIK